MSNFEFYYKMAYRRAGDETELRWHSENVPALLKEALQALGTSGTALDIGCGTGINSVFLAQQGLAVTGVDFVPEAIGFARQRAMKLGVKVNFVHSDILEFAPDRKFDLILDNRCFHALNDASRIKYKRKLLESLNEHGESAAGAEYVLIHLGKKSFMDFSLIGPKKRRKPEIEAFFGPELTLVDFRREANGSPLFQYRFRRTDTRSQRSEVRDRKGKADI